MRLEDIILKLADTGEAGRTIKKGVGMLAGGLMDIAFPFLIPTQDVVEGPGSSAEPERFERKPVFGKTVRRARRAL